MAQVEEIKAIIKRVPIIQNDQNWNCVVWVEEALIALHAKGGDFCTIPQVGKGSEAERKIEKFAEEAKRDTKPIKRASDFQLLDMHVKF